MGGLLVWGIDAQPQEDGIDCAIERRPISLVEKFKSRIVQLSSELIMPRNELVEVELISSTSSPNSGYLLVHVGRSERRPHRSEAQGDGRYYKRVG